MSLTNRMQTESISIRRYEIKLAHSSWLTSLAWVRRRNRIYMFSSEIRGTRSNRLFQRYSAPWFFNSSRLFSLSFFFFVPLFIYPLSNPLAIPNTLSLSFLLFVRFFFYIFSSHGRNELYSTILFPFIFYPISKF